MAGNSDNKIAQFVDFWRDKGDEKQHTQQFWTSLLRDVLGAAAPEKIIDFEKRVKIGGTKFIDGYIAETRVAIEQKGSKIDLDKAERQSDGAELTPYQQAKRYNDNLPFSEKCRWIVVCNFRELRIYDMEQPEPEKAVQTLTVENLTKEAYRLQFLIDQKNNNIRREEEVSLQAGLLVGKLYGALIKEYINPNDAQSLRSLNILCVRLVFCLYAEDAGLFASRTAFEDYVRSFSPENVRDGIIKLFRALDTKLENRDRYDTKLQPFPYVNGGLFRDEQIEIPNFTDEIIDVLCNHCAPFNWSDISPTIFGAVFESTLNPETRRHGGMHYTSIANIHKVIDPLFMNDLEAELEQILATPQQKQQRQRLHAFQQRLGTLRFLDPACGSGNFLTETYLSLRRLENRVISALNKGERALGFDEYIYVKISQFYGIEINDFAVTVAKTALWIAESQMMAETEKILGMNIDFLPLKTNAYIVEGNALRTDWSTLQPTDGTAITEGLFAGITTQTDGTAHKYDYIMGNPPFVGNNQLSDEQRKDLAPFFPKNKTVDYVACWYFKAAELIKGTNTRCAFVSTNSITQGEQVAILWNPIFERFGIQIDFAWRTFRWDSESNQKAHVHCVIVGFGGTSIEGTCVGGTCIGGTCVPARTSDSDCMRSDIDRNDYCMRGDAHTPIHTPIIYNADGTITKARNINPYLIDADNVFIESRNKPLCDVPEIRKGNQPTDGGHLIIEADEYDDFIKKEPLAKKYIKRLTGAKEYINNLKRYCLWFVGASPAELRQMPYVMKRIEEVRKMRLESSDPSTVRLADTPHLFRETNNPETAILVPSHSSENREYIPLGFIGNEMITTNATLIIPNATLYHFGILTSSVHMAWMRAVCGRLEMRYRYSKDIVYNNFPWPVGGTWLGGTWLGGTWLGGTCVPARTSDSECMRGDAHTPDAHTPDVYTPDAHTPHEHTSKGNTHSPFFDKNADVNESNYHYLPHWHQDGKLQFVTFRLADSLPKDKLDELSVQKEQFLLSHPKPWDEATSNLYYKQFGARIDEWLDDSYGSCCLRFPSVAQIVVDALRYNDGGKYTLHAYSVMPNHVHILIEPLGDVTLSAIMQTLKSYTAHAINKILGTSGELWQTESFDRMIRSEEHYKNVIEYIKSNKSDFMEVCASNNGEINGGTCVPARTDGSCMRGDAHTHNTDRNDECMRGDAHTPIERTAQAILDARAKYPDSSLADLYDPVLMPAELRKAHLDNDRAVMAAYGFNEQMTEQEIVAQLFAMYEKLTGK